LTANTVNGSGNGARSGAQTLVLLAMPLNVLILQSLANGPKQQATLRREAGSPAQTTLRAQLRRLTEIGAVEKHRRNRFPGVLEYELTASGRELLLVAVTLKRWLEKSPSGPLLLSDNAAKAAIKALAEGWSTAMLRAVAARPLSLTQLDRVISSLSYPSLERRLSALRLAGLVESRAGTSRGTPYAVTDWLRHGIAPLIAAARWERRRRSQVSPPITPIDVEAALLLTLPLLSLSPELSGSCRMAAEMPNGKRRLAGVMADVSAGTIASCSTSLQGRPESWALGSIPAWLGATMEHDLSGMEFGGDCELGRSLIDGLHRVLFPVQVRNV
jgi:DNA-binding HxlR family transcriptional regulator